MFIIIGGDGKEYGPVPLEQVNTWIANGRANLETRAKIEGTDEWKRLGEYPEFGAAMPPPLTAPAFPAPTAVPIPTPTPTSPGVTPVAAVLPDVPALLPPASPWLRLAGAFIDTMAVTLFSIPTFFFLFHRMSEIVSDGHLDPKELGEAFNSALTHSLPYLAVLAVIQGFLITTRGQSIGKLLVGIRIVRHKTGAAPGFVHAFLIRSVVPTIIGQIPLAGFLFWMVDLCFIFRDDHRCLHDLMADTVVIKK